MQMQPAVPDPMRQQFTGPLFDDGPYLDGGQNYQSSPSGSGSLDTISRFLEQAGEMGGEAMPFSPLGMFDSEGPYGMFGQLGSWAQQAGSAISNWMNGAPNYGSEQYFSNASGGSVGDPHLSFNGSTWNDMQSEPDLLHSDSIPGGYQLSTQTTQPNANGVTYNQSATVTTHGGRTQVSLNNNGNATITQDGVMQSLAPGQTVQLGDETITANQNGSLQITTQNENGGQITTTMTQNGQGVDVNVCANNVDLGGAMVNGSSSCPSQPQPQPTGPQPPLPVPHPIMRRYDQDLSQLA
ncbi:MAG TPA: hypothetical protein VMB20_03075 [Candidatus Acidoferrum sp.]|nr:hypothetical protein [Candidatus Acidoferrum sp.]